MKIALLEPIGVSKQRINELSKGLIEEGHSFTYYDNKTTDVQELVRRTKDQDIIMIANNPYPAEAVLSNDKLAMLSVAFTGIDHVAVNACRENKVTICNASGYSNICVSELCLAMAIDLYRYISKCDTNVRNGGTSAGLCGREICGKKVGIIGCGEIGFRTAKLFQAFGAKVYAYARHERKEVLDSGIEYATLEELLTQCDIISLHVPNNAETKGMISKDKIALMKKDAIFINCARGPIVDNNALAEALNEEKIAGAAIDVYDMEPPIPKEYPLLCAKNTLLTPHIAFLSEEAMERRAQIVFENVYKFLAGTPINVC